jgi:hypothetical protein
LVHREKLPESSLNQARKIRDRAIHFHSHPLDLFHGFFDCFYFPVFREGALWSILSKKLGDCPIESLGMDGHGITQRDIVRCAFFHRFCTQEYCPDTFFPFMGSSLYPSLFHLPLYTPEWAKTDARCGYGDGDPF